MKKKSSSALVVSTIEPVQETSEGNILNINDGCHVAMVGPIYLISFILLYCRMSNQNMFLQIVEPSDKNASIMENVSQFAMV